MIKFLYLIYVREPDNGTFFLKNLWNILQYCKEQSSYKADVPSDHPLVRHLSHVTSEANSQFLWFTSQVTSSRVNHYFFKQQFSRQLTIKPNYLQALKIEFNTFSQIFSLWQINTACISFTKNYFFAKEGFYKGQIFNR